MTFWQSLDLNRKPISLSFFLTSQGKKLLKGKYFIYNRLSKLDISLKKGYNLSKDKIGEDKKIEKKPENLTEFINHGKKK